MNKKSTISNLEHKLLFIASSLVPLLFIATIFLAIYDSYFPSPPSPAQYNTTVFSSDCRFSTFLEQAFLTSFLTCGFLTSIFVFSKRIFYSWFVLFFPLILAIFSFTETIFSYYEKNSSYEGINPPSLISVIPSAVLIFGGITIFLFLWNTKVIIQDRFRDKQLGFNLP